MNAKMISTMAGIFSILNTIQFFIFELNQITHIGFEDKYSIYLDTDSEVSSWAVVYRNNISIGLCITTVAISCFFLFCLDKNMFMGLIVYTLWIIIYELFSFTMILLIYGTIKEQFKELGNLYLVLQISRMLLHFTPLPFIVKHGYSLYKDPKTVSIAGRRRRSSVSTVDSWPPVGLGSLYRKTN
ncbi:transmembrane protein 217-like [Cricetulus griseus]|uniref:Transmembrane protein 217 n=2 Tax=Cricetulus griseus TaxID=10029 RepID=G3HKD8_CRIGR|nr:transmembrane protein 217-like [Cricetulus griseus]XP_027250231.1 transmembrane protein 217-like [Cricetulus griseus]EGW12107.1 Transmembrane protein 217 [Cricetulus griseus]ERE86802.1 transmembrane protein [Cricetulus griseus]